MFKISKISKIFIRFQNFHKISKFSKILDFIKFQNFNIEKHVGGNIENNTWQNPYHMLYHPSLRLYLPVGTISKTLIKVCVS